MHEQAGGYDLWQLAVAALVGLGGGLLALWRSAVMVGRAAGRIDELENQVGRHEALIQTLIDKNDARHEANLRQFAALGERIAGLPDQVTQRVEQMLDKRHIPL